jgi:hypothetical protein
MVSKAKIFAISEKDLLPLGEIQTMSAGCVSSSHPEN